MSRTTHVSPRPALRTRALRVCGAIVLAAAATRCGSSSSPSTSPSTSTPPVATTLTLSGVVADQAGKGILGAKTYIVDGPNAQRSATTDSAGAFSIASLSPGGFTVLVTAAGYKDINRGVTLTQNMQLDMRLDVAAWTLTGAIVNDSTGAAISGATISILDGANSGRSAATNSAGAFTLANLSPGGFSVRATASGYVDAQQGVTLTRDTTIQLRLQPQAPPPPPPPPPTTSGTRITFETDSTTCRCTSGTIRLQIDAAQAGTMSCSTPSSTFGVVPGGHRIAACDNVSCWPERNPSVATGAEYKYIMICTASGLAMRTLR